jgi:esterase
MQLYYNSFGSESLPSLIVLHGLLGSSDNWLSFGKIFGTRFRTFLLDARNHGQSPHSDVFNYQVMADDIEEFIRQQNISSIFLLGHSMGGKTAALLALTRPEVVEKLIVLDIAPRSYPASYEKYLDPLTSLDLNTFIHRKDIHEELSKKISEEHILQFLMKNIKRGGDGRFQWKVNLESIRRNSGLLNEGLPQDHRYDKPALFIRGENSEYIQMEDLPVIGKLFPKAELVTIKNAGHWVHVDAPSDFIREVFNFLTV